MKSNLQKTKSFIRVASILLLLFILSYSSNSLFAQNVTIPDVTFKNALLADPAINTDNDDEISVAEATAYTGHIDVSGLGIANLNGIEAFTNLFYLDCSHNSLTSLNVSGLTSLTELYCDRNSLTSLNVSGLTTLTHLRCNSNSLSSLNASGLTSLQFFTC